MDYDINTQMSEVRKIIGVCPQFDILWDQLTAAEHLRMYAAIKEVPW
jgi:ABC-type multidrug transport system ATPase subunit